MRSLGPFVIAVILAGAPPIPAHVEIERQVADVSRRIAENPRDASLLVKRGELHRVHGDTELALADFRTAGEIAPDLPAVDLCTGRTHLEAGRPDQALPCLDRFLLLLPDHVMGRVFRARALAALGRRLEAAVDYTEAIRDSGAANPPRPELYLERALALRAEGPAHVEEALDGLREGLSRLGPLAVLQTLAVDLEVERGDHVAALDLLETSWKGARRRETFHLRRGEILEGAGWLDEACIAYEESQASLDALPPGRRRSKALIDLELRVRAGLERLSHAAEDRCASRATPASPPDTRARRHGKEAYP
jgi:tetratricopeptide (TPR) repeat protein